MATFKSPVLLLLLTLFLSSAFLSLGFHLRSPRKELSGLLTESNPRSPRREEHEFCRQRCQEEQGHRRQQQCQQQCEQRLREREQREEEEEDDPREQYEQCQEHCQRQQRDQGQQRRCQQRCRREFEERQEEEERRRDNSRDPREQFEQCRERCERQQSDQRQQRQCQQRCRREFEERQEEEESRRDNSRDPRQRPEEEESRRERCEEEESRCERSRDPSQRREEEGRREGSEEEESRREHSRDPRQQREEQEGRRERREEEESRRERREEEESRRERREEEESRRERRKEEESSRERRKEEESSRERREEEESHSERESEQEQRRHNPFLFRSQTYQCPFRSEHGRFRVVPRFNQRSKLLRGIENYRLSILEAKPNTFVIPHHSDSEAVYVVIRGKATITFVNDERRQSFKLRSGNAIRVPAGTTVYIVNAERDERLVIAALREPVNAPGRTREFFLSGLKNPKAYMYNFSSRVLEPSLNSQIDQIRKVFSEQSKDGMIRSASAEQLRALSAKDSSSPRPSESGSPIKLLNQHPLYSNENGRFYEACPREFRQLRNMDVSVLALQLNKDSIFLPHFNSRQTTLLLVTEGSFYSEIISPQPRRQRREQQREEQDEDEDEGEDEEEQEQEQEQEGEEELRSGRYQRVSATANAGDLLVIPADHPVALVASGDKNAKAIGFGINAKDNQRTFLAGQNNLVKNLEEAAQELSFGVSSRLVEQVFDNQEESYFVSRQRQQREEEEEEDRRGNRLSSILDIARLF